MAIEEDILKHYLADSPPSIVRLEIKPHFEALTAREKLYAHWISIASFAGTRVVLRQVSPEAELIYEIFIALHKQFNGDWNKAASEAGLSSEELKDFLSYAAQFLGNCGNFKSFGDTKFVPRLPERLFKALASLAPGGAELWTKAQEAGGVYAGADTTEEQLLLGYPDKGHITTYYPDSPAITKDEISRISSYLEGKKLLPENTRIRKVGSDKFEVLIASEETTPTDTDVQGTRFELDGGTVIELVYGDYKNEMKTIAHALQQAAKYAANDTEKKMLDKYVQAFRTGSMNAFVDSQREWIKDKGPTVESDIGFIETYRDPHGIRGEWEGFVAMVNKERTKAFSKLVEQASTFIPKLPWSKAFEKDTFLQPDFTSLEVLTFAGSGIPAGINIPNFDVVRQNEGFKNVSLGNVLSAKAPNEKIPFIHDEDLAIYQKYRDPAFEVQVGLHELLGHGCGKLLQETAPGVYNFDIKNPPTNPLTNKPVDKWYGPGQTWGSVFGALAGAYEECRAECVAMSLSCDFEVLKIFGFGDGTEEGSKDGEAGDILYAAYLSMARAGVAALEFWDPKSSKWGQPHMQARYSILQTMLNAGEGFARLDYSHDDLSDLTVRIDRTKITSVGRKCMDKYLQQLHIYKATADYQGGSKMFTDITTVNDWYKTKLRPVVLSKKMPRKVFVQANTVLDEGNETVTLKEYDASPEGMIQSFAERTYI